MKKIFLVVSLILLNSCNRGRVSDSDLQEIKDNIIKYKDRDEYDNLYIYHPFEKNNYFEVLPYSLSMIKNSSDMSCYDFCETYLQIKNSVKFEERNVLKIEEFKKLEQPEKDFFIYLLKKGASKNDSRSQEILIQLYKNGVGVNKNSKIADSISKKIQKF